MRRQREEQEEFNPLSAVPVRTPQQNRRLADFFLQKAKRKRKKRRKRRTPRTSSRSLRGRARRRLRQWQVQVETGFAGYDAIRAVFLRLSAFSVEELVAALAVDLDSGWVVLLEKTQFALCLRARPCSAVACTAGFAGVDASRAVFPSLSSGLRCSASWPVWTRRTVARSSCGFGAVRGGVGAVRCGFGAVRGGFGAVSGRCFPKLIHMVRFDFGKCQELLIHEFI